VKRKFEQGHRCDGDLEQPSSRPQMPIIRPDGTETIGDAAVEILPDGSLRGR
jgi:hypothetical protein